VLCECAPRVLSSQSTDEIHQAKGYNMAGVEYSSECYCGSSYRGGALPPVAPISQCQYACAGNPSLTCGGSWGIQIYESL
jgi:hypothetical protein